MGPLALSGIPLCFTIKIFDGPLVFLMHKLHFVTRHVNFCFCFTFPSAFLYFFIYSFRRLSLKKFSHSVAGCEAKESLVNYFPDIIDDIRTNTSLFDELELG